MLSYESLKYELNETKQALEGIDLTIKKITGHNFRNMNPNNHEQSINQQSRFAILKRKYDASKIADDLTKEKESPNEDEDHFSKHSLRSAICAATEKRIKSRAAIIKGQTYPNSTERNRRMFGFVLGTLKKFEREEDQRVDEKKKRAEIDKKLEAAAVKEQQNVDQEKQRMFLLRNGTKRKMRCLEKKMEILYTHETWERNENLLKNFLQTKTRPRLMYLPARLNERTSNILKEQSECRDSHMDDQWVKIKKELSEIDYLYTTDDSSEAENRSHSRHA